MCDPASDELIEARGFTMEDPVLVMARPIGPVGSVAGVEQSGAVTEEWIETQLDVLGIDRSLVGPWVDTLEALPAPSVFFTTTDAGSPAGVGFGVVVDDLLGSFELAVSERHRRKGHATRMMNALHAFGLRHGARTGYLQVVEENRAAVGLYEALGYETVYRYWYRVLNA